MRERANIEVAVPELSSAMRRPRRRRRSYARLCAALALPLSALSSTGCGLLPDVVVESEGEAITSESGTNVVVSVRLARRPSRAVTVRAVSSDATEGIVSGPVVFDGDSWDTPQLITVSGVDDAIVDGDVAYSVSFEVSSQASPAREAEVLDLVNRDDDQVAFELLGDLPGSTVASFVTSMSASGAVVVGYSGEGAGVEAFSFTREQGLVGLGAVPSRAHAVSPNGLIIAGRANDGTPYPSLAVWRDGQLELWDGYEGMPPDARPSLEMTSPRAVQDRGVVFGQCGGGGAFFPFGCQQSRSGELDDLWGAGEIFAVDELRNIVGARHASRGDPINDTAALLRFDRSTSIDLLYPLDSECSKQTCSSVARDLTPRAGVIVGTARVPALRTQPTDPTEPLIDTGFVFTASQFMVRLPDVPDGSEAGGAYSVSDDGRVIGGFGNDASGRVAVVWIDRVASTLATLVAQAGGAIPAGFRVLDVIAVSADGLTFAGNGISALGNAEGFRVTLPALP